MQAAALLCGTHARRMDEAFPLPVQAGLATQDGAEGLQHAHRLAFSMQMALRMVAKDQIDTEALGAGAIGFMVRAVAADSIEGAEDALRDAFDAARDVIDKGLNDG